MSPVPSPNPTPADPPSLTAYMLGGAAVVVILGLALMLGALAMRKRNP